MVMMMVVVAMTICHFCCKGCFYIGTVCNLAGIVQELRRKIQPRPEL